MKKQLSIIFICTLVLGCKVNSEKDTTSEVSNKTTIETFTLISEINNLPHCESVVYDKKRNVFYATIQAENAEGDGAIAKISADGKTVDRNFITGLNDPKGIVVKEDKLYVSDIVELVEIDIVGAKIIKKHKAENSEFLNDVTIDNQGNVYVSEMFLSSIYKLTPNGKFIEWFKSAEMENPNGLLVLGNTMYIGAWGKFTNKNPLSAPKGRLLKLDMVSKEISQVTEQPLGNLDGLQVYDNDNFLVSDWVAGKVFKVSKQGNVSDFFETKKSVGDILYIQNQNILGIPLNLESKLLLYKVEK